MSQSAAFAGLREQCASAFAEVPPSEAMPAEPAEGSAADSLPGPLKKEFDEINLTCAVVVRGSRLAILQEYIGPDGRPTHRFISKEDFFGLYAHKRVSFRGANNKMVEVLVAKAWFEWEGRRQYKGVVFAPGREVPGYYNLYRGFDMAPAEGDWSLMKAHILNIICGGVERIFLWLLAWMAHIVQNPGGPRPGVAIVLLGKQGTGKGIFVSNFGALFRDHFLHITNPDQLTGKFNAHLESSLVVFVDEGFWAGDKAAEGVLKSLITEECIQVEPKGKDSYPAQNLVNILFATNNDWAIPAGIEERRFLVLDVSAAHCQDHAYFGAIAGQMKNGGRAAMLYELLHLDISGVNLRSAPRTKALLRQIVSSLDSVGKYWFERLREGDLGTTRAAQEGDAWYPTCAVTVEWGGWIESDYLYRSYLGFAGQTRDRYPATNSKFFERLHRFCPGLRRVRRTAENARPWGYELPPLEECRSDFERAVGVQLGWED